ncbi:hypothetical protein ACI513_13580 [Chryseobacterium sp. M5]|uniref:hypothetical protein n=1 Tax=Chryseobacterium sp. M5 TaxID=3379128 RepID=UPI0038577566
MTKTLKNLTLKVINARVGQANLSRNILFQELRNNNVFLAVIIQKCVFLNIS